MDDDTTFSRQELGDSRISSHLKPQQPTNQAKSTVSIADLLAQIQKLEDSQRHQLFLVLKEMETTGDMSASNLQRGL